jgi:hypothetical protein
LHIHLVLLHNFQKKHYSTKIPISSHLAIKDEEQPHTCSHPCHNRDSSRYSLDHMIASFITDLLPPSINRCQRFIQIRMYLYTKSWLDTFKFRETFGIYLWPEVVLIWSQCVVWFSLWCYLCWQRVHVLEELLSQRHHVKVQVAILLVRHFSMVRNVVVALGPQRVLTTGGCQCTICPPSHQSKEINTN